MKAKRPRLGRRGALTLMWWGGGMFVILTLAALSRQPALLTETEVREVWEWLLPNIMPTLTLVGAAAYAGKDSRPPGGEGATLLFFLCLLVSGVYLFLLADAVLYLQSTTASLDSLRSANLWLGPIQALASSLLAFFFVKPPSGPSSKDEGSPSN
jgi:hypothetical protein